MTDAVNVWIQAEPIDLAERRRQLPRLDQCGGYVAFEGIVRDRNEGKAVTRLEYECYETLAVKEIEAIGREALARFGVTYVEVVHRVGSLAIGETAVVIQVLSGHRKEAFLGCEYVIDELKKRAPIWKKEHYVDGTAEWTLCSHNNHHEHRHDDAGDEIATAVIVTSDRARSGVYEDKSGPAAKAWLEGRGFRVTTSLLVADDEQELLGALREAAASSELVVVSGGTGLGPRDITPQVLGAWADYPVPGIGELLRQESLRYSKNSHLSRCGAFVKDGKLLLALPGNPKAVTEQLDILGELLPRTMTALKGRCRHR